MAKIMVRPGDSLVFVDKGEKEIIQSTYNNALSVLRENLIDETEYGELVTYKIPDWLAKDKGLQTKVSGKVKKETDKAILLQLGIPPHTDEVWLPKSQITLDVPPKDTK